MNGTLEGMSIMYQPALTPPAGVVPNFVDPPGSDPKQRVKMIILHALFPFLLGPVPLYTRFCILKRSSWQDYVFILAFASYVVYIALIVLQLQHGAGINQWNVPVWKYLLFDKYVHVGVVIYNIYIMTIRAAILLQFMGFFVPPSAGVRRRFYLIHILLWTNVLFYISVSICEAFTCRPDLNSPTLGPEKTCLRAINIFAVTGAVNIIYDLIMLGMPLIWIWKLQLPASRKVGVFIVFGFGTCALVFSIMREVVTLKVLDSVDRTYDYARVAFFFAIENCAGFLCYCLPSFPKFVRHFKEKLFPKQKSKLLRLTSKVSTITSREETEVQSVNSGRPLQDQYYSTTDEKSIVGKSDLLTTIKRLLAVFRRSSAG
ncbi:hypothetical protein M501DRAFT_1017629 [Patellaria atrata CBS 101060]|uniref:Rhodopsin domain-containing protein n=1 Tax=Patellaria atrata CBS 101060 TaxID=1346257 RepID=A0A9P4VLT1_9PEZI|nr:hypothetical protein M501DRAFT_1017629 [Patellaria atrata CBS 101060]